MDIIIGKKRKITTIGSGDFFCPTCAGMRDFEEKRVKEYFAFLGIRLIYFGIVGEYLECDTCNSTFNRDVVSFSPKAFEKSNLADLEVTYHEAIRHVMIAMMLADGVIDKREIQMIRQIYSRIARSYIKTDFLEMEINTIQNNGQTVWDCLARFAHVMNNFGKESVLEAAFQIASADKVFEKSEQEPQHAGYW